jgi:hypothetical protein
MTPDSRDPVHRGRRQSDQIFEGWTWGRVTKIATALTVVGGLVVGISSAVASILVTRPELKAVRDTVASVNSKVDANAQMTADRLHGIELRQDEAEAVHSLLPAFLRFQCLTIERDRSTSLAARAALPCDSLLRRVR